METRLLYGDTLQALRSIEKGVCGGGLICHQSSVSSSTDPLIHPTLMKRRISTLITEGTQYSKEKKVKEKKTNYIYESYLVSARLFNLSPYLWLIPK